MRALPRPQIRSHHAARLLQPLRLLQQHRRIRPLQRHRSCPHAFAAAAHAGTGKGHGCHQQALDAKNDRIAPSRSLTPNPISKHGSNDPTSPRKFPAWWRISLLTRWRETNRFANAANTTNLSTPIGPNTLVPGKSGQAVQFTGDDEVDIPECRRQPPALGPIHRRLLASNCPQAVDQCRHFPSHRRHRRRISWHRTFAWTKADCFSSIKRFWPGNAIAVRSASNCAARSMGANRRQL